MAMRKLILAGVVASLLVAAPVASANIVVGKSIAGVSLGMTEQQVITTLGPAKKTTNSTDEITGQPVTELAYNTAVVDISNGSVILIATRSKKEKTANGVGVGTTEKKLKQKIKGVKCAGKKVRICVKGSGKSGTVVTAFSISKSKKVTFIVIGLVLD
jgi:hypothetical protein